MELDFRSNGHIKLKIVIVSEPGFKMIRQEVGINRVDLLLFGLDACRMAVMRLNCRSLRCLNLSLRFTCRVNWLMV